jgi:hypothetical protein
VLRGFFTNYLDFNQAFAILFSRTITHPDGIPYTVEDLREMIADFEAEARAAHDPVADLYRFALREGGRHLYLYDPTSPASTGALNGPLEEMQAVAADPVRFQTPYSELMQATLTAEMIRVAGEANEVYTQRAHLIQEFEQLSARQAVNRDHLGQMDQQIVNLAERVRLNEVDLLQINAGALRLRINEINAQVLQRETWIQELDQINTEDYITYHNIGNFWRVTDGAVVLEDNKKF